MEECLYVPLWKTVRQVSDQGHAAFVPYNMCGSYTLGSLVNSILTLAFVTILAEYDSKRVSDVISALRDWFVDAHKLVSHPRFRLHQWQLLQTSIIVLTLLELKFDWFRGQNQRNIARIDMHLLENAYIKVQKVIEKTF